MPLCNQFIYTTGKVDFKTGYQVISKSEGVTENILSEMNDYLYPLGINPAEFRESRSLLALSDENFAYSMVKNIGIGYDGRDNTVYNHTIIISKKDFAELKYDTRLFDNYFVEEPLRKERILPLLAVQNMEVPTNYDLLKKITPPILEVILKNLFESKKIAIVDLKQTSFIPNLLSIVPPSVRLLSFSTLVNQPDKQTKYDFIQISKKDIGFLPKHFEKIDISEIDQIMKRKKTEGFEKNISYFLNIIYNKEKLSKIFNSFEELPSQQNVNKINLILNYEQFQSTADIKDKERLAYDIFESIEKFESSIAIDYLEKINASLGEDLFQNYYANYKVLSLASVHDLSIDLNGLEKFLHKIEFFKEKNRMMVIGKLVENKIDEFLKNGSSLLIEVFQSTSWFRNEIFQIFVQNEKLSQCIFEIFENNTISKKTKQEIFRMILEVAEIHNPSLIPMIVEYLPFDLRLQNDSKDVLRLLRNTLHLLEFKKVQSTIILKIIGSVRKLIQDEILKNNIKKERAETIKNIHEISTLLRNSLYHVELENTDEVLQHQITEEKEIIEKIYKKIKPKEEPSLYFDF